MYYIKVGNKCLYSFSGHQFLNEFGFAGILSFSKFSDALACAISIFEDPDMVKFDIAHCDNGVVENCDIQLWSRREEQTRLYNYEDTVYELEYTSPTAVQLLVVDDQSVLKEAVRLM